MIRLTEMPEPVLKNGRGSNGRFAIGNSGGPGRPRREVERSYLSALTKAVALEDWVAIIRRAVEDAIQGDAQARAWLSKHLVGDTAVSLAELAEEVETLTALAHTQEGARP
jgi:hypothetical protein